MLPVVIVRVLCPQPRSPHRQLVVVGRFCVILEEVFLDDLGNTRGDVARTLSPQVVYYEDVSWRKKRFRVHELFSHGGRRFGASGDGPKRVPSVLSRTCDGDLESIEELGYRGRSEDELHARVLPCLYSTIDCRFCKWEELRLNPFASNEEDHAPRRRGECHISVRHLAAFRRVFTVDPLRRFSTPRWRYTGSV